MLPALVEYLPTLIDLQLAAVRASPLRVRDPADAFAGTEPNAPYARLSLETFGSPSRLFRTVTKLWERGFLTRARRGANQYAALTESGRRTLNAAAPGHINEVRSQIVDHLPAGRAPGLADLLRPLVDNMKATAPRSWVVSSSPSASHHAPTKCRQ